jgi:hypothetical protein
MPKESDIKRADNGALAIARFVELMSESDFADRLEQEVARRQNDLAVVLRLDADEEN